MVTKEDLEKRYSNLSNSELLDIIENKFSYTELAVTVAIEEIGNRKVTEEEIKLYKEKKVIEFNTLVQKNIYDDLSLIQKNLFFFIWIPYINFFIKRRFLDDEAELKLIQANYYSWFGFITFAITTFIGNYLHLSDNSIILWLICFPIAYYYDEYFNRQNQIRKLQRMFPTSNEENVNDDLDIHKK
ncbi:hypothetical protein [Flavobacterium sp.]|jgi:hypothetical protein|uniref:hypothetical protein n=1 Tax=Flavobacterium sp. TaxID=239 RepID=UPI001B6B681E|nr:hypothetical protein [Flavobacterium sp.]MBP6127699.1 hypothetical protein [Flavobacterium sp.]